MAHYLLADLRSRDNRDNITSPAAAGRAIAFRNAQAELEQNSIRCGIELRRREPFVYSVGSPPEYSCLWLIRDGETPTRIFERGEHARPGDVLVFGSPERVCADPTYQVVQRGYRYEPADLGIGLFIGAGGAAFADELLPCFIIFGALPVLRYYAGRLGQELDNNRIYAPDEAVAMAARAGVRVAGASEVIKPPPSRAYRWSRMARQALTQDLRRVALPMGASVTLALLVGLASYRIAKDPQTEIQKIYEAVQRVLGKDE